MSDQFINLCTWVRREVLEIYELVTHDLSTIFKN